MVLNFVFLAFRHAIRYINVKFRVNFKKVRLFHEKLNSYFSGLLLMTSLWRKKITIILLIIYWSVLLILAHIPIPQLIRKAGVSDKSLHFLAYLILTYLFWFSISPYEKVNWRKFSVWLVLIIITIYGSIDELVQKYVGRTCDAMDIAANLAGTLMGLFIFSFLTFWPSALIVTGIVIFCMTNIMRTNLVDLLPVISSMINPIAYSIFTAIWLQNMTFLFLRNALKLKFFLFAIGPPIGFLITVKIFSLILGRDFRIQDIIFSLTAIIVVVSTAYLKKFPFKKPKKTSPN